MRPKLTKEEEEKLLAELQRRFGDKDVQLRGFEGVFADVIKSVAWSRRKCADSSAGSNSQHTLSEASC